jgi:hypothetical protein
MTDTAAVPPAHTGVIDHRDYVHSKGARACQFETAVMPHMAAMLRRHPDVYNALPCNFCRMYRPIEEFTWADGSPIYQSTTQGD